jgi:hypothetical protein
MKHGKNPTVKQMKYMQSLGLDPENWLVSQDTPTKMILSHRYTGRPKTIDKDKLQGR